MKKKLVAWAAAIALVFGLVGFVVGIRIEGDLLAEFSEDVVEVRQGKLAGAFIAMQDNEELSEQWEELCSDILREGVED